MIRSWIVLCLIPLCLGLSAAEPTKVDFYDGSFATAKQIAAQEGKLIFVDFVASWCMPCRWMDETTFSDPSLGAYVKDNYIAVKIDIDDFDGFAYKQQYNIKLLPSILVFNSSGTLVGRYEESLAPSKMMSVLQKHDLPANRVRSGSGPIASTHKPPVNTSPSSTANTSKPRPPISRPPLTPSSSGASSSPSSTTSTVGSKISNVATKPIAAGDGLFRFKVTRQASKGFSVQVGAFGHYGNVLTEISKLQDRFDEEIIVHIVNLPNKTIYKVLVGEFATRNEAISYRDGMKTKGIEGIIKDLSTMK